MQQTKYMVTKPARAGRETLPVSQLLVIIIVIILMHYIEVVFSAVSNTQICLSFFSTAKQAATAGSKRAVSGISKRRDADCS